MESKKKDLILKGENRSTLKEFTRVARSATSYLTVSALIAGGVTMVGAITLDVIELINRKKGGKR